MRVPPADLQLYYVSRPPPTLPDQTSTQTYFPSLETLFPSLVDSTDGSPTLAASELAISVSGDLAIVEHMITHKQREVPVWRRAVHLVEPLDYLEGEYVLPRDGALPASRGPWQRALRKINDPFNEAYTDAVFACMASRLVETGRSPHWCRFYGTTTGRSAEYTYNITDDMEDIETEDWFRKGIERGSFRVVVEDPYNSSVHTGYNNPWAPGKPRLQSGSAGSRSLKSLDGIVDLDDISGGEAGTLEDLVEADVEDSGEKAVVSQPRVRLHPSVGPASPGSAGSEDHESEDDLIFRAILKDFPVQKTLIERCDGTLDDLMEDEVDECASPDMRETKEQRWTAWIFQVVAALAVAQQTYDFVHNDLHTNNIMWCGTGETHLYYHIHGAAGGDRYYRVPTYGRILKIIDFGRATFRPPVSGPASRLWIPDAYAPGADAAGQYNCGQYFEQGKPKVQPNRSFDLCRLAVAILDTLWEEVPPATNPRKVLTKEPGRAQPETTSPLWNLMWLWLTDKSGKNILRGPDDRERYPEFNLYCAIARDANNAVPAQQITLPLFDSAFRCRRKDIPTDIHVWKVGVGK
jgi:hypothetical protein